MIGTVAFAMLASVACASAATRRAGCFTARALRACRGIDGEGRGKGSIYRLPDAAPLAGLCPRKLVGAADGQ